jgi:hypothetical protein
MNLHLRLGTLQEAFKRQDLSPNILCPPIEALPAFEGLVKGIHEEPSMELLSQGERTILKFRNLKKV